MHPIRQPDSRSGTPPHVSVHVWILLPQGRALYTIPVFQQQRVCIWQVCRLAGADPAVDYRYNSASPAAQIRANATQAAGDTQAIRIIMTIRLKTPEEQDLMRVTGRLTADALDMIGEYVKPGVSTAELDQICHDYIIDSQQAIPAPLNYRGFPKSICTSINHVVCHGIPSDKKLRSGDCVNIDITVIKNGLHGDSSRMFHVGKPNVQAQRTAQVAFDALWQGIRQARPGARLGDIGHAIQEYVESQNCSVVREYCGHGIGYGFHEDPQILHYGRPNSGVEIEPGMTFTIEPMVNAGKRNVRLMPDGWTVVTKDHSLSAQWEHTLLITDDDCEILTLGAADRIA